MRVAAFNVENLFDRARAFNGEDPDTHREVLDAHAELNKLFEEAEYTDAKKARMLEIIGQLGMLKRDEGPFTRIRKIRGQLISRPRTRPALIKTNGRDDWVGWCELRTTSVNETAIMNTGHVIRDVGADVLAVVEAESRPVVKEFQRTILKELGLVVPVEGESGQQLEGDVELESISAVEGKSRLAVHQRRERNSDLIRKKKSSVESLVCEACGINTEDVYGVDCSEVHHKVPIGEMESEAVTTLDDLQIVCPTCHRAIHKRKCSVGDLMNSLASKGLLYKNG